MKHIEITVSDSFDDETMTVFEAIEEGAEIGPASPVSREDLLEALEGILDTCYDTERNDETIEAVSKARAALAKARGEG